MLKNQSSVIVSYARTPQGKFLGNLKDVSATTLGSAVIKASFERAHLHPTDINEVIMGCVLPAGLGQAPARQAALKAGLPSSTSCTTINKVCGSGMKAVMFASDIVQNDPHRILIAGGMESMSNAPYLLLKARQGYRLGTGEILDHMMLDGLEDAYEKGKPMGYFAETCAAHYQFNRETQDNYAMQSFNKAKKAIETGLFSDEIIPITIETPKGNIIINQDEPPYAVNLDKLTTLKPAFKQNGTITAGNACSIADGAASLVIMSQEESTQRNIKPIARIVGHACFSKAPHDFATAPIDAIKALLEKCHWSINDVDLFEINEAFAVVTLAALQDLKIPAQKLNIHGGGCALGHPVGATGARIIITLLSALKHHHLKRGIASLCIGGGEATAIAVEIVE